MSNGAERPVWTTPAPGSRQPRYSREEIADTAIAIADAEGFDAVSMRRVATDLGAGTMTLYHYVPNKRDLLALMADRMMVELLVPDEVLVRGWRAALTEIAKRSRDTMRRHAWLVGLQGGGEPRFGPNAFRHFEQSLAAVAELQLEQLERLEVIALVDSYVFGVAAHEEHEEREHTDEWLDAMAEWVTELVETGEFPHVESLFAGEDPATAIRRGIAATNEDERFERGLEVLLDGIALRYDRR
jgi:AcrR family transcriptional regulator